MRNSLSEQGQSLPISTLLLFTCVQAIEAFQNEIMKKTGLNEDTIPKPVSTFLDSMLFVSCHSAGIKQLTLCRVIHNVGSFYTSGSAIMKSVTICTGEFIS